MRKSKVEKKELFAENSPSQAQAEKKFTHIEESLKPEKNKTLRKMEKSLKLTLSKEFLEIYLQFQIKKADIQNIQLSHFLNYSIRKSILIYFEDESEIGKKNF